MPAERILRLEKVATPDAVDPIKVPDNVPVWSNAIVIEYGPWLLSTVAPVLS